VRNGSSATATVRRGDDLFLVHGPHPPASRRQARRNLR
jgi:hypothetical protein